MGIIDSKNLLTATENIKPKATKPYSKRRKNPFAKQFKLTDRNAPKDALSFIEGKDELGRPLNTESDFFAFDCRLTDICLVYSCSSILLHSIFSK